MSGWGWNDSDLVPNVTAAATVAAGWPSGVEVVPEEARDPLYIVVPITVLYAVIFLSGVVGNVSTCVVIARNKSMHTATNYYLFSLAVSDLLLLVSGLPPEMYRLWWPQVYMFGEVFCMVQSFSAETSANATVLTITAFTVERYVAICHPFLTHTMSKLSRAVKFVVAIWLAALCLAVPQAIQYGMWYAVDELGTPVSRCTMTRLLVEHAFEISTLVFFAGPMTVITVLYVLIALKLRHSRHLAASSNGSTNHHAVEDGRRLSQRRGARSTAAQNRVIKMLVAVVVAFFVCWAPFHAQRLLAVHMTHAYDSSNPPGPTVLTAYLVLNYASGVLYFLSTTVNPLLYNIMSNKFREAFKSTLAQLCDRHRGRHSPRLRTYSTLSRYQTSVRHHPQPLLAETQTGGNHAPAPLSNRRRNTTADATLIQLRNSDHAFKQPAANGKAKRHKFRPRGNSNSSQTTVLTSLSRSVQCDAVVTKNGVRSAPVLVRPRADGIRAIAQKLKTFTRFRPGDGSEDTIKSFVRQKSVDSANTISDSSLQDLDETEFSSSDLVKYMEEVNHDLAYSAA